MSNETQCKFKSLDDFLKHQPLTVDGLLSDGWGENFAVKGREIEATILFADISAFSQRTKALSSTEMLIYVNHFFCWITAEALRKKPCLVDKYIGDEVMLVFSKEFGSADPFFDALFVARGIIENDTFDFSPHIGIASGQVTVGYVGTQMKYDCSVFGLPVIMASRCAAVKTKHQHPVGGTIIFPSNLWTNYEFSDVFPKDFCVIEGKKIPAPSDKWEMLPARDVEVKRDQINIREIIKKSVWFPNQSPEERAKESLKYLAGVGQYKTIL